MIHSFPGLCVFVFLLQNGWLLSVTNSLLWKGPSFASPRLLLWIAQYKTKGKSPLCHPDTRCLSLSKSTPQTKFQPLLPEAIKNMHGLVFKNVYWLFQFRITLSRPVDKDLATTLQSISESLLQGPSFSTAQSPPSDKSIGGWGGREWTGLICFVAHMQNTLG